MRTQYTPPQIDEEWLLAKLKDDFQGYKNCKMINGQLYELVQAYVEWWRLMITFPERKILATPPIWYIRIIHSSRQERFFFDCFSYLGQIPQKEQVWRGREEDISGVQETAISLRALYDQHSIAWGPIVKMAEELRSQKIVQLH